MIEFPDAPSDVPPEPPKKAKESGPQSPDRILDRTRRITALTHRGRKRHARYRPAKQSMRVHSFADAAYRISIPPSRTSHTTTTTRTADEYRPRRRTIPGRPHHPTQYRRTTARKRPATAFRRAPALAPVLAPPPPAHPPEVRRPAAAPDFAGVTRPRAGILKTGSGSSERPRRRRPIPVLSLQPHPSRTSVSSHRHPVGRRRSPTRRSCATAPEPGNPGPSARSRRSPDRPAHWGTNRSKPLRTDVTQVTLVEA
ncbi:hypothetical protein EHYA_01184 [Embleya hyalina]|uniref:Uncharacterized protein n=1 Tax=Embleya hyalina TaxID=516124 RepID=A0A401YG50_9ACTN|nr:hypothetical protein EHYA_01184 [Embleya hyalina]